MNSYGILDIGMYHLISSKSRRVVVDRSSAEYTLFLKRLLADTEGIPKYPGVIIWVNRTDINRVVNVSVTRSGSRGILRRKIKDIAYENSLLSYIGNSSFVPGLAKFRKFYHSPPGKIGPEATKAFPRPLHYSGGLGDHAKWYADNDPGAIKAFLCLMNTRKNPSHVIWYANNSIEIEDLRRIKGALIARLCPEVNIKSGKYSKSEKTEKIVRELVKLVRALPYPDIANVLSCRMEYTANRHVEE